MSNDAISLSDVLRMLEKRRKRPLADLAWCRKRGLTASHSYSIALATVVALDSAIADAKRLKRLPAKREGARRLAVHLWSGGGLIGLCGDVGAVSHKRSIVTCPRCRARLKPKPARAGRR